MSDFNKQRREVKINSNTVLDTGRVLTEVPGTFAQLLRWRIRLCKSWTLERHLGIDFKITKAEALGEPDYHHKHEVVLARQGDDKDSPGREGNV